MKVLGMLRATAESEANAPQNPDDIARIVAFVGEAMQAGVLVGGEGLLPSVAGKRMKLKDGKLTITDGPFTESKELIASYALFDVKSMDEAVHWSKRFLEVLGEGECELRPIVEGPPGEDAR